MNENVIVYLTALVAIGIIIVGLLTTFMHSTLIAPVVVIGLILFIFVILAKGDFAHKIENIERSCFFITFIAIILAFILLYRQI